MRHPDQRSFYLLVYVILSPFVPVAILVIFLSAWEILDSRTSFFAPLGVCLICLGFLNSCRRVVARDWHRGWRAPAVLLGSMVLAGLVSGVMLFLERQFVLPFIYVD